MLNPPTSKPPFAGDAPDTGWLAEHMRELISVMGDAPKHIPKGQNGKNVQGQVPFRWCMRGAFGFRLRFVRVGGRLMTHPLWLAQFFQATAGISSGEPALTPTRAKKNVDRAMRELASIGAA